MRNSERRGNLPEVSIAKRVGMGIWLVLWVGFAGSPSPPIALFRSVSLGSLCANPREGSRLRWDYEKKDRGLGSSDVS